MTYLHSRRLVVSALGLTLIASSALSQTVIPGSASPDQAERQYRIEDQRPNVSNAPLISLPEEGGKKQIKSDVQFVLKDVQFEGLNTFTETDLKPVTDKYVGQKISLNDLNRMAGDVTAFYRNQGFILTRAIVPPQKIDQGTARLKIVEGFVSDVVIQGDVNESSVIHSYAEKIRDSKPLNAKTLERYLLLMEDLPGVSARAVLQPSPTTPGASQVVVNITRKMIEGSLTADNRGSRFLGPGQAGATFGINNVIGWDEQTELRALNTAFDFNELHFLEARHEEQVGSEGTVLVLSGNYVHTEPGHTLEILDVVGNNVSFSAGLTHPILRSRQSNLYVNTDFTMRHITVSALSSNLYEDYLRVVTAGASYDFLDGLSAVNRVEANVHKGFDWDTDNGGNFNSRANGEESFWKFTAKATRLQPISGPFAASFAVSGQYAASPLLAAEEFALGGQEFGSAYDAAELTGDHGLAGRFELQYNQAREADFLQQYQIYGFYDAGRVWNRGTLVAGEAEHISLASTGLGARFNVIPALSGSVEAALPLTKDVSAYGDKDARLFFALQYRY